MRAEPQLSLAHLCAKELGLTRSEVLNIVRIAPLRYKVYTIPKRSGGDRLICQPSRELKLIQRVLLTSVLNSLPVHESSTAYERGCSILNNATIHKESRVILKLDFKDFFNSIVVEDWIAYATVAFPSWDEADLLFSARALFFGNRSPNPKYLSIGAPTSPHVANVMLFGFDDIISIYCIEHGMCYSRYADDITISSKDYLDQNAVMSYILNVLKNQKSPSLILNESKTKLYSKSSSRRITGLILTNDGRVSLGRDRKRLIRAMLHRATSGELNAEEMENLRGLLAFAESVEPLFVTNLLRKYGSIDISRRSRPL